MRKPSPVPPPRPPRKLMAPPPPRPDGALENAGRPAEVEPRVKKRPVDALNVDLSKSEAPRSRVMRPGVKSALESMELPLDGREGVEHQTSPPRNADDSGSISSSRDIALSESKKAFDEVRSAKKSKPTSFKEKGAAKHESKSKDQMQEYFSLKEDLFSALIDTMDVTHVAALPRDEAEEEIGAILDEIISIKGHVMSTSEQRQVIEDICDDVLGYGPLEPLLERDDIADIMVNGAGQVFIETDGQIQLTSIRFRDNQQLLEICQRMVSRVGRRVDESSPICDARLLDGSRVNVIAPPLAIDGTALTIRKFKKDKLKLADLVRFGSITAEGARVLEIASACRCNILISGGTGSGKTTLLNCLSGFAADDERIVTCEDSAELQLQQPHVVRLETRPPNLEGKGKVTMGDLVKNCLRMRPERIIVGEVRGPEAFDLLQAMNTGHDGSMGTLHANTPREAISRMESMITMGGFSLPNKTVREMICSAVNVIVQAQRLRDGSRRITHVTEIVGMEGETVVTQDVIKFLVEGEDKKGKLVGRHVSTGVGQPKFYDRARSYNLEDELTGALACMDEVLE